MFGKGIVICSAPHVFATIDDGLTVADTLSYGLRFGTTGKAHRLATDATARIAAQVLVDHLEQSGFVLMKRPPARTTTQLGPGGPKRLTE